MKNWKTTITGVGAAIMTTLGIVAQIPYDLGDLSTVLDPTLKKYVTVVGLSAGLILKIWNSFLQADKPK